MSAPAGRYRTMTTAGSGACVNCGHDSPHVQQDGDECWCRCTDYETVRGGIT